MRQYSALPRQGQNHRAPMYSNKSQQVGIKEISEVFKVLLSFAI
jgi:hypothetical protein